jgi:hypothetical protein
MIISIVGKLKNVGREGLFVFQYAAIFCGILVKDRVGSAGNIFVRIDSDENGVAYGGIDGI